MRWRAFVLASAISLFSLPQTTNAVYNANIVGRVTDVLVYTDYDFVLFRLDNQPAVHPLCNVNYFALSSDMDPGRRKSLLARLLLAKATGEPTNIGYDKEGACANTYIRVHRVG